MRPRKLTALPMVAVRKHLNAFLRHIASKDISPSSSSLTAAALNPKSEIGTAHLTQSFGHPWFETGCGVLI